MPAGNATERSYFLLSRSSRERAYRAGSANENPQVAHWERDSEAYTEPSRSRTLSGPYSQPSQIGQRNKGLSCLRSAMKKQ
jgi:hypothetical protein